MMRFDLRKDYYAILGVPEIAAMPKIINAVFKKKALILHPDKGGTKEAFQELNEARMVLLDPVARSKYDAARKPKSMVPPINVFRWENTSGTSSTTSKAWGNF